MSLIGQLPLAAVLLTCKDIEGSKRFYKDVVGLKPIEEIGEEGNGRVRKQKITRRVANGDNSTAHFDLGNIRLTLTSQSTEKSSSVMQSPQSNFVFVVENAIDAVYADLSKRGVKFKSKKILEDSSGKAAWFSDPDGNMIYIWQPPHRDSKNYKDVEAIVRHYELVSRALADLREDDDVEG